MNLEELMASTPPMQQHALIKGFQAGAASRDAEIQRLQMALADAEALELGTDEKCNQLRTELEAARADAKEAWEKLGEQCIAHTATIQKLAAEQAKNVELLVSPMNKIPEGGWK